MTYAQQAYRLLSRLPSRLTFSTLPVNRSNKYGDPLNLLVLRISIQPDIATFNSGILSLFFT